MAIVNEFKPLDIIVFSIPKSVLTWAILLDKARIGVDDRFAQFTIGVTVWCCPKSFDPFERFSVRNLHIEVEDVDQNYQRLSKILSRFLKRDQL